MVVLWRSTGEQAGGQASWAPPLRPPKPGLAADVLSCLQQRGTSEVRSICRSLWPEAEKKELPHYKVRVRGSVPVIYGPDHSRHPHSADACLCARYSAVFNLDMPRAQVMRKAGGGRRTQHCTHDHDSNMCHERISCARLFSFMQVNGVLYKLEKQGRVNWSEHAPGGRRQWSLAQDT